jgi:hypothetical protein
MLSKNQKIGIAIIGILIIVLSVSLSKFGSLAPPMVCKNVPSTISRKDIDDKCITVFDGHTDGGMIGTPAVIGDCMRNASMDPNYRFRINGKQIVWANDKSLPNRCLFNNGNQLQLGVCPNEQSTAPAYQFGFVNGQLQWLNDGTIPNQCVMSRGNVNVLGTNVTKLVIDDCSKTKEQYKFNG